MCNANFDLESVSDSSHVHEQTIVGGVIIAGATAAEIIVQ